tara:strand:+ start:14092 stop:15543 length:1452 start_codon:yes stop_codon:yes gene_type:complete
MAVEKNIKINVDAKDAIKQVDKLEQGVKKTGKGAKDSKKGFSAMKSGVKRVGLAFKAMGIGLIVAGFAALKDALAKNQAVMDKVNIASVVIGDIFQKLVNTVMAVVKSLGLLGKAVGKVLKGEFKEAGDLAKQSFDGVKEAVVGNSESFKDFIKNAKESAKETVKYANDLVRLQNEVKLAEANQRQLQLTYQKDAEIQRQLRDDISLTFEERIAANTKLGEILNEQFAEEQALANKKVELAELELSRNKDNIDLQVALINAKTELADLDERITGQRSEQLTNLKALEKEQADAIKATADAKQKELEDAKKAADEAVKIAEKEAEAKAQIERDLGRTRRDIVANALGSVASLIGEETKAGKALAVGQALINTYSAATAALAQPPVGAGPIFGPIAAVGAVAAGLANVKKIVATKLPGVTDDGGGTAGATPAIPQAGGIGGNLIPNMNAITPPDTGVQPVQAFVVENDISNAQALQEELDIQATL